MEAFARASNIMPQVEVLTNCFNAVVKSINLYFFSFQVGYLFYLYSASVLKAQKMAGIVS